MKNLYIVFDLTDGDDKPRIGFADERSIAEGRAPTVHEAGFGGQMVLSV